ncbi:MAG: HPF/RaiA family ribosome-associated protein [Phycisphaerales bacterium]|nr:HPF/RaiA family ribosome-associated protein [Phycisphaerales bacterium]
MPPRTSNLPIHIKPGNLQTSAAIEAWVRRKLAGTFRRYGSKMTAVEVHFEDVNGLKHGGDDIRCVMEARVNGREPVAVRARADDLYAAIDAAARKLDAAIRRAVERIDTRAARRFRQDRAGDTGRRRPAANGS